MATVGRSLGIDKFNIGGGIVNRIFSSDTQLKLKTMKDDHTPNPNTPSIRRGIGRCRIPRQLGLALSFLRYQPQRLLLQHRVFGFPLHLKPRILKVYLREVMLKIRLS